MEAAKSLLWSAGVSDFLGKDLLSLGSSAAGLAIVLHLTLFRTSFPTEDHLHELLILYIVSLSAVLAAYLSSTDYPVTQSLVRVCWIAGAFNTGLVLSIGVYRLFFHRLRHFPGPIGSKVSRFYDTYLAGRNVQYNVEIEKLHKQHGDFIRTGPREICIVRRSALPVLFGPQSKCRKSTYYAQASTNPIECSVHHTRDFEDHRKRRKAWDRGFSIKSLGGYEPRIKAKADQLAAHIAANLGNPIDATAWSMFLSFDVMGDVGFGKNFGNLTTGVEHPAIRGIHDHMAILGVLGHVPWFLNLVSHVPGATAAYSGFFKWCGDEIERKQKIWDAGKYPDDIVSWLLKAYVDNDAAASPSEAALHEDSRVVIIAGSETTATTLATVLFYLAKYKYVLAKLQRLLDEAMPGGVEDWSYDKVKTVSFLDDIINEALRLRPAVMTGGYRVTPAEGLQIDEVYIPGDVNVFVPAQLIQTDERYYKQAKSFIPERWGERKGELGTDGAPFIPFAMGPYSCPGKNLALLSLRITVSVLALQYSISFAPGETGEDFEHNALDTFTTTLPPLRLQFFKRQGLPGC
ncbi:cytochrome P450 [Aspergillus fijiensis CBS 313.89]|uniref:Monooxygenase n=1 Tax=Aspergillus fijiensis CBS 313.89 TaxID=1448319 RepID=A0A8G1RY90_9EURO|nr:monooxygenase [Aspergillus fijiensis CBS 313.89]RAK81785.1 monooxygenase [Aspergillus fijiensis CBS 313.89]